jgi:glycosyltransferase involved in cell wall biosynthesis
MLVRPEVSVVMGVYNAANILSATVESILSQDGVDFEFIIVNDGSKDESGQILEKYASKDGRMKIIHQENHGLTKALIKGCAEARGAYIARQDAGDISLPDRLKLQKAALDMYKDISFVSCITEFCGPEWEPLFFSDGNGLTSVPTWIISDRHEKGVIDGPSHHGSVMFRKSAYEQVGGYRQQFYVAQDWDLWYRLAEIGKFLKIPEILYRARLSQGSISALQMKRQSTMGRLARESLQLRLQGMSDQPLLTKSASVRPSGKLLSTKKLDAAWFYFIGECLRRNGDERAYGYLRRALLMNPFSAKTWVRTQQALIRKLLRNIKTTIVNRKE